MEHIDVAVIGDGQSGLATAHAPPRTRCRVRGVRPVVLKASERAAGSWPRYYDSLTLSSPARYGSLPGSRSPAPTATATRTATRSSPTSPPTPVACTPTSDPAPCQCGPPHQRRLRGGDGGRRPVVRAGRGGCLRVVRASAPTGPAGPGGVHRAGAARRRLPQPRTVNRPPGGGRRGGELRRADRRRARPYRPRHARHPGAGEVRRPVQVAFSAATCTGG